MNFKFKADIKSEIKNSFATNKQEIAMKMADDSFSSLADELKQENEFLQSEVEIIETEKAEALTGAGSSIKPSAIKRKEQEIKVKIHEIDQAYTDLRKNLTTTIAKGAAGETIVGSLKENMMKLARVSRKDKSLLAADHKVLDGLKAELRAMQNPELVAFDEKIKSIKEQIEENQKLIDDLA